MSGITAFAGISGALNAALNISKALLGIRDQALIQQKIVELTSEIISAQHAAMSAVTAQSALTDRIHDLEKQIMEMETWETEKQRYELKNADSGAFAYMQKPGMEGGQPPHWLCANCYEGRKKGILQTAGPPTTSGPEGMKIAWRCPICSNSIRVSFRTNPQNLAARGK